MEVYYKIESILYSYKLQDGTYYLKIRFLHIEMDLEVVNLFEYKILIIGNCGKVQERQG
jgi:hypothetical protein